MFLPKGKAVHNSPNFKPKFGDHLRAKMDKNHFQEIKLQFSEEERQRFLQKNQHNKNIKEQFYLYYLAQNLQEQFCSLLKF